MLDAVMKGAMGTNAKMYLMVFLPRLIEFSQVLAERTWLNRRQPHWRSASCALRALVLCVEHGCLPQFGALSSPASHPT
jgi:hypothetical protein